MCPSGANIVPQNSISGFSVDRTEHFSLSISSPIYNIIFCEMSKTWLSLMLEFGGIAIIMSSAQLKGTHSVP